jgi:hypothetical protein
MSARLSIAGNRVASFVVLPTVRDFDCKHFPDLREALIHQRSVA